MAGRTSRYDESKAYVLVAYEKHGERFLDATTKEKFLANALALLRERVADGWYFEMDLDRPQPEKPEISQEQIMTMPDGQVKKLAQDQWQRYREELRERAQEDNTASMITVAIEEGDGELAWEVLLRQSYGEYDRVELKILEVLEGPLSQAS